MALVGIIPITDGIHLTIIGIIFMAGITLIMDTVIAIISIMVGDILTMVILTGIRIAVPIIPITLVVEDRLTLTL